MKEKRINPLGIALKDFLGNYLPNLRGISAHTILSYRDSLKLFLQFLASQKNLHISKIEIQNIQVADIIAFLDHLETVRGNSVGTRNIRLATLHSFSRYLATTYPEYLDQAQRILNIPFKRTSTRMIEYLEFEEIQAVLRSIDCSKPDGRRDHALLLLMFNTGARVQEIIDLRASDCQLSKPFSVRIFGKGRRERICPIWEETARRLREYMEERGIDPRKPVPIFSNHLDTPLTRYGIRYILSKYLHKAAQIWPSLKKKRLHPHSMRHSTAIHLLKSGVDLSTIASWLGHVSINTTNKYVTLDLEMKTQAIAKAQPFDQTENPSKPWRQDPDILAWLESL